jgi:LysM repeat protein
MGRASAPFPAVSATVSASFALAALASLLAADAFASKRSPEQMAIAISKLLKPISDDDWKTAAGSKVSEKYSIVKGDTLYGISKRLLGDPKYWPKLWALNNDSITNPHFIQPGVSLSFQPGTGTSLPAMKVADASPPPAGGAPAAPAGSPPAAAAAPPAPALPSRSEEWKDLPHQRWETVSVRLPPEIDPLGFDTRSKITQTNNSGIELDSIAASDRIVYLGQIVSARTEATNFSSTYTVFIRADEDIQIGETYAMTREPTILKARRSDRIGYSYRILGSVKIIGVRDNLFIGQTKMAKDFSFRGASLIPMPKRVTNLVPINGPDSLEGIMMLDHTESTYIAAQHKLAFVDRGTEDGVKPGNVFRAFQHYDQMDQRKLTNSDFIIDADILLLQCSERFSVGLMINSLSPVVEGSKLVLLTDVSDLLKHREFNEKSLDAKKKTDSNSVDELEKLDTGLGIGKDEEKELQQLEKWKGNPPEEGKPSDVLPPPPASEEPLPPPPEDTAPAAPPAPEAAPPPAPEAPAEAPKAETAKEPEAPPPPAPPADAPPPAPEAPPDAPPEPPPPPGN